jgi:hypothetical protein
VISWCQAFAFKLNLCCRYIEAVLRATADGGGVGGGTFSFGAGLPQLRCRRPLSLQVLRWGCTSRIRSDYP